MSKQADTKQLWKLCFGDSDDFIRFYFDAKYSDENTFSIYDNGVMVCVLQAIPYKINALRQTFEAAYISGACTHPDYRNKGYMRNLLQQTLQTLKQRNIPLVFLIPQEEWLYNYYAQFGFSPDLYRTESEDVINSFSTQYEVLPAQKDLDTDLFNAYEKYAIKTDCVLHDYADFVNNLTEIRLSGGNVLSICNGDDLQAFALLRESTLEVFGDSNYIGSFSNYCKQNGLQYSTLLTQNRGKKVVHGMVRIICPEPIVEAFTKTNSQQFSGCTLVDSEIVANNKIITNCNSIKTLNSTENKMIINELTSIIFQKSIFVNCMME